MPFRFQVKKPLPDLGLVAGDIIVYDPSNLREPYQLYRAFPIDPGAVLNQLSEGNLEELDIIPPSQRPTSRPAAEPRVLPLRPRDQQFG